MGKTASHALQVSSVMVSLALCCGADPALGQQPGPAPNQPVRPEPAAATPAAAPPDVAGGSGQQVQLEPAAAAPASAPPVAPPKHTSTEQGRTHLDKSFDWHIWEPLPEKYDALKATEFNLEVKTFYFDQNRFDDSERQAWALGGSIGAKTGYFLNHFALGGTFYTSQPLYAPEGKGNTKVLKPDQDGYSVFGEYYLNLRANDLLHFYAGAKGYDSPYINRHLIRMTPNTFQAYVLRGSTGTNKTGGVINYAAGYFDKIKLMDSDSFESMSSAAGVPEDRGVVTGGAHYTKGIFNVGAINYFCADVINIAYAESGLEFPISDHWKPRLTLQFTDQRSVGSKLLTGGSFEAQQFGIRAELPVGHALFTAAYTQMFGDYDLQSPWGGVPGWTSVQVQDFDRQGEGAFLLRGSYKFTHLVDGLSAYALVVFGTDPDGATQYRQNEYDFNVEWAPTKGFLKNLSLRMRYAIVEQSGGDVDNLTDFRVIASYNIPIRF